MIGKTEADLRERFGPPTDEWYYESAAPNAAKLSRAEIDRWYEREPERGLVYGDVLVQVNISGRIVGIRSAIAGVQIQGSLPTDATEKNGMKKMP